MREKSFSESCDFQITTGNVQVHYVEGNHMTILDSDKVVAAINKQYTEVPVENNQL